MERTQDKPSTTQDLKQDGAQDRQHEGARESRPERPLAAEGKSEHKDDPMTGDKAAAAGEQDPGVHAEDGQAMDEAEGSEDAQSEGDEAPSKAI